jgi:transposase
MDVVHPRCAGVDISKRDAKVCVRIAGSGRAKAKSVVTTWGAVTNQVLALRDHLIAEQVTLVVMEATSDYWKPFVRHEALFDREGMKGPLLRAVAAA